MTTKTKTPEIPAHVQKHIDALTPDMLELVPQIKNSMQHRTTQHGYGAYMSAMLRILGGRYDSSSDLHKLTLFVIARAMIAAKANEKGIKAAAALIAGEDPTRAMYGF